MDWADHPGAPRQRPVEAFGYRSWVLRQVREILFRHEIMLSPLDDARDDLLAERFTEDLQVVTDDIVNPDPSRCAAMPTCNRICAEPFGWPRRTEKLYFAFEHSTRIICTNSFPGDTRNVCIHFFLRARLHGCDCTGAYTIAQC